MIVCTEVGSVVPVQPRTRVVGWIYQPATEAGSAKGMIMTEVRVRFQKFNRRGEMVTEEKTFATQKKAETWVEKQADSDTFVRVVAWSDEA